MTAIEEAAKRLHFPDGGRARLFLYPKALPYRAPDHLWYLVHVEEAVVKGGSRSAPTSPGPPSTTWSSPRGGTWSPGLLRARGPWDPPGLGVR